MNVLLIKMSSLGDLIHTFPALTDAGKALPDIHFDWVVEENFAEIPAFHPLVRRVIPIGLRRWKKSPWQALKKAEWPTFKRSLQQENYPLIIDAQGLIKSAIICQIAHGETRVGLDKKSLTEPLARFAYQKTVAVDLQKQAIFRMRSLFAQALNYPLPSTPPDYGIPIPSLFRSLPKSRTILFLHGTTWPTKHWPDAHWITLAHLLTEQGFQIQIPWSQDQERERALRIQKQCPTVTVLPLMTLTEMAQRLTQVFAVISVDTGLAQLSAALGTPTFTLYGPTNPERIGTVGLNAHHIISNFHCRFCDRTKCRYSSQPFSSACLEQITPEMVLQKICDFYSFLA